MAIVKRKSKSLGCFSYDDSQFKFGITNGFRHLVYIGTETDGSKITIPEGILSINYMFRKSKITSLPRIPDSVTTATEAFSKCRRLTAAILKAKNLRHANGIFSECISLEQASLAGCPHLICAGNAFNGCINLRTCANLPRSLSVANGMFMRCTSLISAPAIPCVKNGEHMFERCTSMRRAPAMPEFLVHAAFMFYDSGIRRTPDMSGCVLLENCESMFNECRYMTKAPSGCMPPGIVTATRMFRNTAIRKAPDLSALDRLQDTSSMYENCKNLTSHGALPSGILTANAMFRNCVLLSDTKTLSFAHTELKSLNSVCSGCLSLKAMPSLPVSLIYAENAFTQTGIKIAYLSALKNLAVTKYMFKYCHSLRVVTLPPGLFDAEYMLKDCVSLESLQGLNTCTNLTYAKNMCDGCTRLDTSFFFQSNYDAMRNRLAIGEGPLSARNMMLGTMHPVIDKQDTCFTDGRQ